jgi:hypothetical protein
MIRARDRPVLTGLFRSFILRKIQKGGKTMRKIIDWLIGGNLDRLLRIIGGET